MMVSVSSGAVICPLSPNRRRDYKRRSARLIEIPQPVVPTLMKIAKKSASILFLVVWFVFSPAMRASTGNGLKILGPAKTSLAVATQSIALSPELELTNTTQRTLGITHLGGGISDIKIEYNLRDMKGHIISLERRDFLGPTLSGARVWVTLLRPGESMRWKPEEALIYSHVQKQKYLLTAHLSIEPPSSVLETNLSDSDRDQITKSPLVFDSGDFVITVQ